MIQQRLSKMPARPTQRIPLLLRATLVIVILIILRLIHCLLLRRQLYLILFQLFDILLAFDLLLEEQVEVRVSQFLRFAFVKLRVQGTTSVASWQHLDMLNVDIAQVLIQLLLLLLGHFVDLVQVVVHRWRVLFS